MKKDLSLYLAIRREDQKGESFGKAAFESNKNNFSTPHTRDCIKRLLKQKILKEAFDPLLEVPGLQQGMRFSTLHKLCCAKSDEEAAAYLKHTFNLWLGIALESKQAMKKIATEDVQALELRCPKLCSRDAADINDMFNNGSIFVAFDQDERKAIKEKILSIDYVIPSLSTFFQDFYLLNLCAQSMRHIVTPADKMTIRTTLRRNYKSLASEQSTEEIITSANGASTDEAVSFDLAMELLWIFVLGEFQRMPPPNKGTGGRLLADYLTEKPHIGALLRFATLAKSLGFETPEIIRLSRLTIADKSEHSVEHDVDKQPQLMDFLLKHPNFAASFILGNSKSILGPESYARVLRRRCGRPKHDLYQHDRTHLKKELIHFNYGALRVKGQDITSFLVLRSQCLLFFSSPREDLAHVVASEPTTTENLEISRPSATTYFSEISEQDSTLDTSESSQNLAHVVVPEPAAATTNISQQWYLSDSLELRDIRERRTASEIPGHSHNEIEHMPPPEERHSSSPKPASATKFQFITYKKGRFEICAEVDGSDKETVQKTAENMTEEGEMKLYNLSIFPIDPKQCFNFPDDMHTVIALRTEGLKITENLRNDAKSYRQRKQDATRQFLRR